MSDQLQIDRDIKLINQFRKECGETTFINRKMQDPDTIIDLISDTINLSKKLIKSDVDRHELLNDVCMRAFEHFNNLDNQPVVFSPSAKSANVTLREMTERSTPKHTHGTSPAHPPKPPQSPRRH
jgi:hypothetical protein